jgi:type I restriction enzyme R subunit
MSKSGLFRESVVEEAALEWYAQQGYATLSGADIAPGEPGGERASYADVVLNGRLREALARLNPAVPPEGVDEAFRRIIRVTSPQLVDANHELHTYLVNGVTVEYAREDGTIGYDPVRLLDFDRPGENDWLVVNQLTVTEGGHTRRPDLVVFVNGLPLAVIELKNAAGESATVWDAFQQLQTYKDELPSSSCTTSCSSRRRPRSAHGHAVVEPRALPALAHHRRREPGPATISQLEVLIRGVFEKRRFLDLAALLHRVRETTGRRRQEGGRLPPVPRSRTGGRGHGDGLKAAGDRRVGVVWHTQGSGKSLTMAFYAGRVILHPAMANPTLVVLTDRNDLDDQLFGTFARCHDLLRQTPSRRRPRHLRELLAVASGGVVFTTIQKFLPETRGDTFPLLSDRAQHRGHRRRGAPQPVRLHRRLRAHMRDALPNASFIGFTGTPIEPPTRTRARCSATTSASTTSSAPCRTAPRCPSTTRAGSPSSSSR